MKPINLSTSALELLIVYARDGGLVGPEIVCSPVWQGFWDRAQDVIRASPEFGPDNKAFGADRRELADRGYTAGPALTQCGWDLAVEACATLLLANGISKLGVTQ